MKKLTFNVFNSKLKKKKQKDNGIQNSTLELSK